MGRSAPGHGNLGACSQPLLHPLCPAPAPGVGAWPRANGTNSEHIQPLLFLGAVWHFIRSLKINLPLVIAKCLRAPGREENKCQAKKPPRACFCLCYLGRFTGAGSAGMGTGLSGESEGHLLNFLECLSRCCWDVERGTSWSWPCRTNSPHAPPRTRSKSDFHHRRLRPHGPRREEHVAVEGTRSSSFPGHFFFFGLFLGLAARFLLLCLFS